MEKYHLKLKPILLELDKKTIKFWQNFNRTQVELKNKKDIVTEMDKYVEKFLIKKLSNLYPEHSFLGEEGGRSKNKSSYLWIIDPIDGTTNFSIHNPLWSYSIALMRNDELIFGLIYAPLLKESFHAYKGAGAYLNNKRISLNLKFMNKTKQIHSFCHGSEKKNITKALNYYKKQKLKHLDCRQLGSAAIELAYVSIGRLDSLYIPGANLWDIAAGVVLAHESGALVLNELGKNWKPGDNGIIACHPSLKNSLLSTIKEL